MKKKQITATQRYFTDYRDMKFKLTAHRLDSENRNTVLWNKNYRNTAPKITQYRKPLGPPPLKQRLKATQKWPDIYGVEDTENQQGLHYCLHWEDAAPIRVKAKSFVEF